jgi:hypothetical protein
MSITQEDPLYSIFEQHLHSGLYDEAGSEQLVLDVVDFYWQTLSTFGHVPLRLHESLRADMAQDVQDMLRSKIYGHYGVGEYNRTRLKKN